MSLSFSLTGATEHMIGVRRSFVEASARESAIGARLDEARRLCERSREKLTPQRLRTLEMLLEADGPVKAYDVMRRFYKRGGAKPPTVYRSLRFWERMGLVQRIGSLNAFVACRTRADAPTAFFLCQSCGASEEIPLLCLTDVEKAAQAAGFKISQMSLEVKGLCQKCH